MTLSKKYFKTSGLPEVNDLQREAIGRQLEICNLMIAGLQLLKENERKRNNANKKPESLTFTNAS